MKSMRKRVVAGAAVIPILGALAGCSTAVPMQPADDATNPECAEISVRLPDVIDEHEVRTTDAQATAAWGEPAVILLRCGVAVPGPSTQRCITIDGVDWLVDDSDEDAGIFRTYGRDPAVEVVVDQSTSESNALNALAGAVGVNPAERTCTSPEDATIGDDPVLEPAD